MNILDEVNEIWKDIKDWPFYQVSDHGRIRVLPGGRIHRRLIAEPELRNLMFNSKGYLAVSLNSRPFSVHRIVLNEFVGPCPPGQQCRHLNGNKLDNRLDNLEWGTPKENQDDRYYHGTDNRGERNSHAKLTQSQIDDIRAQPYYYGLTRHLAIEYGVSQKQIQAIRSGYSWKKQHDKNDSENRIT